MNAFEGLAAAAGRWSGRTTLRDADYGMHEESASDLTVTPVAFGRFVRLDYTWACRGEPQEGSLLVGLEPRGSELSGHWLDSWHNGHRVMTCAGDLAKGEKLSLLGSYPAPPGPDWGWRIELTPAPERLRLTMFNVAPGGREELAVAGVYARPRGAEGGEGAAR
jgi:hypothetical protein